MARFGSSLAAPNLTRYKLLVVEDDGESMLMLCALLKETGAEILKAESWEEALKVLGDHPDTNVALVDLQIAGLEVTRSIKAQRADLPVIALTAFTLAAEREKAKEARCDYLLTKPVNREMLYKVLENYLQSG